MACQEAVTLARFCSPSNVCRSDCDQGKRKKEIFNNNKEKNLNEMKRILRKCFVWEIVSKHNGCWLFECGRKINSDHWPLYTVYTVARSNIKWWILTFVRACRNIFLLHVIITSTFYHSVVEWWQFVRESTSAIAFWNSFYFDYIEVSLDQ